MSRPRIPADEQRVNLTLWFQNGSAFTHDGEGERRGHWRFPEVSVGRTDSERGLGFLLIDPKTNATRAEFVLDRTQVENLHAFLGHQIARLKPMPWPKVLNLPACARTGARQRAGRLGARRRARRRS